MLLLEDEVYIGAKNLLRKNNWKILAGQPPNGCDHLPVVEIKDFFKLNKGSRKSYKPDLIAYKEGIILLVECKPDHSKTDTLKLREILSDPKRIEMLFLELEQRNIFQRHKITISKETFLQKIHGALAHSGLTQQLEDLSIISVLDISGQGKIISPIPAKY